MDKRWVKCNLKILPNGWICPYLIQIGVETTQHCLECNSKC